MTTVPTVPTFETLYEAHYARIYQRVLSLVRNVQDAEDVTQDAFCKALAALPRFDPSRGSVGGWLYRIATNAARDHLRKRRAGPLLSSLDDLANELADHEQSDPQTRYVTVEQAATRMRRLQSHYRETLTLRGLGYSIQEIAARLDRSERTVQDWLTEAHHVLSLLSEDCA